MQTMKLDEREKTALLTDWLDAVEALFHNVSEWAQDEHWTVHASQIEITEETLGSYTAPLLEIDTPDGRLILEPIARIVGGSSGRVDFYAWPTLYRVMLLRKAEGKTWVIRTDSGVKWPNPWGRETFLALGKGLLGAE